MKKDGKKTEVTVAPNGKVVGTEEVKEKAAKKDQVQP